MREQLQNIYGIHRQALYSLALTITQCQAMAEDAVHDAFLRMCSGRTTPSGDLVSYLFACVRNAALDQRRKHALQKNGSVNSVLGSSSPLVTWTDQSADSPLNVAVSSERSRILAETLNTLDEASREIVIMKVYGDLTFQEIGQATGTSPKTVESRYRRILTILDAKLRHQMGDQ